MYQTTPGTLDQLGMRGPSAAALVGKLSLYAVVYQMHMIIRARRAKEHDAPRCDVLLQR